MSGAEPDLPCRLRDRGFDRTLDALRSGEILDAAAVRADQVVVVSGEVLGELVPRELVVRHDAVDDARLLEHHEVAVHRALCEAGAGFEDLRDRERSFGSRQHVDDLDAHRRHALLLFAESPGDGFVQGVVQAVAHLHASAPRMGHPAYRRDARPPGGYRRPMDPAERFGSIVRAPEPDIRLDEAAFCIAACARPAAGAALDVDAWCGRIDALAAACPDPTFAAVRELLFVTEGFRGNADDYGDPRNSFLDAVIERRCGIPITLSVLLIEVARRHGIEVLGIGMPGHFLVREATDADHWYDPFRGCVRLELLDCARLFGALHGGVRPLQAADLAPTPPRAILARMLANLEQGRFGTDPGNLAMLCGLHLAIPGIEVTQQVQLLRALARAGDPERVERAYAEVAAAAPDRHRRRAADRGTPAAVAVELT